MFPFFLRFLMIAGVGAAVLAATSLLYFEELLVLLGRDATLTGRTNIWAAAVELGFNRPWFGHGYRSFWTQQIGSVSFSLWGHGHNSYLDLWLELGLVGAGMFLITLAIAFRRALWRLKSSTDSQGLWFMSFLIYMCIFGLTSKVFPDHGTITWVLFVTTLLHLTPRPRIAASSPVRLRRRLPVASMPKPGGVGAPD